MELMTEHFSRRHGFNPPEAEITVRQDAPDDLRSAVVDIAYDCGFKPSELRQLVCRVLRVAPNRDNWSEYPNIDGEVRQTMGECPWYKVYDVIEAVFDRLHASGRQLTGPRNEAVLASSFFQDEINSHFRERGIGWQLVEGRIEVRGPESFEQAVHDARDALQQADRTTAARELHEALSDLSRRPDADVTGAIQHAMAALECAARDAAGNQKATLGELIKRHPDLFPKPLDQALEKMWGYASETGRHLREGRAPSFEEAQLTVIVCAGLCGYLARKISVVSVPVFNS
jgi:hypothetical protein